MPSPQCSRHHSSSSCRLCLVFRLTPSPPPPKLYPALFLLSTSLLPHICCVVSLSSDVVLHDASLSSAFPLICHCGVDVVPWPTDCAVVVVGPSLPHLALDIVCLLCCCFLSFFCLLRFVLWTCSFLGGVLCTRLTHCFVLLLGVISLIHCFFFWGLEVAHLATICFLY